MRLRRHNISALRVTALAQNFTDEPAVAPEKESNHSIYTLVDPFGLTLWRIYVGTMGSEYLFQV